MMNISINGRTYRVFTEADIVCLCVALETLAALARSGKAA
jgi:hypothetical protein